MVLEALEAATDSFLQPSGRRSPDRTFVQSFDDIIRYAIEKMFELFSMPVRKHMAGTG